MFKVTIKTLEQDYFKPMYFFYKKILHAQKYSQAKIN